MYFFNQSVRLVCSQLQLAFTFLVCTEEGLSVGSNVDTYLCKEEPSFSLSDPAAVASSRTKEQVVIDENEC